MEEFGLSDVDDLVGQLKRFDLLSWICTMMEVILKFMRISEINSERMVFD